ncbi:cell division topological specificity factor MinE [Clostridium aciditolerans]|uniref:Cell division topological specificity factor n=1 Tax=Clostridium aciditolerans TaxID=339861 RepID=A0A934HVJ3_9CLOT|nr:cell division topological specificity factor MinE [Clostridium aciditolerans]MBI6871672.1 cell division topological specificity factor MinE [Clostridium aciditolerans]MTK13333.1 cell division topological specificity factor MinE [Clostridiaceae bacterium]
MDLFKIFSQKPSPKDMAKERLKLILIHDRAHVSPEILESIREDILGVISKYFEIDDEEIDVKMTKMEELQGESPALIASIPIKKMKINK